MPIYEFEMTTPPHLKIELLMDVDQKPGTFLRWREYTLKVLAPDSLELVNDHLKEPPLFRKVMSNFKAVIRRAAHASPRTSDDEWTRYFEAQMDVPDETGATPRERIRKDEMRTHACSGWTTDRQTAREQDAKLRQREATERAEADQTDAILADIHLMQAEGVLPPTEQLLKQLPESIKV